MGTSDEIEALKGGINKLISGAAVAFMTSVWGVAFSLLLNIIEKMFERSALNDIQRLQHDIDSTHAFPPSNRWCISRNTGRRARKRCRNCTSALAIGCRKPSMA